MPTCRLGVDIGGTFTDAVLMDEETGRLRLVKMPSTPADPSSGFMDVVTRALREAKVPASSVTYNVHGTTVATNTIIEGKGAKVALIATEGFRDVFEIARQIRPRLYDIFCEKPRPLIPRFLCFEAPERVNYAGEVLKPLDEAAVLAVVRKLEKEKVEAVVVCLLHSYINPAHERRVREIVSREMPDVFISISSDICPEMREYFRASTTAINALIMPVVSRYVERLEARLSEIGVTAGLHLMTSAGGIISSAEARREPVHLVESGPAAGVIAATYVASLSGIQNVISFDMGGTTAKAGLVENGTPKIVPNYEVGSAAVADNRSSGYPVRTPVVDLVEIGAGGGSIAWIDAGGALRVGPRSGGADPGPACYNKGQTQPCITDANLALGRLNPDYFLGGEHKLYPDLARKAIAPLAEHLGLSIEDAAGGIVEIANAKMVGAIQLISVQRGFDPRDFVLVAFGGAGPVHANALARDLSIARVLVPMSPGVTSALGLLVSDVKHDYVQAYIQPTSKMDFQKVNATFDEFVTRATAVLDGEGVARENISFVRSLEVRYVGQSYELKIQLPHRAFSPDDLPWLNSAFFQEHRRSYGFAAENEPTETVNIRMTAIGTIRRPEPKPLESGGADPSPALKAQRPVYFTETNGMTKTKIYDRYRLKQGNRIKGPAIVEEIDSTVVIHPHFSAQVDAAGNLLIQEASRGEHTRG